MRIMSNGDGTERSDTNRLRRIHPEAIEGYQIMQPLGRGSTGYVFRAVQKSMRREVALKVLNPSLANRPDFTRRFLREAQMAGAIHHPNVITCYDIGESQGYIYQALELLDGGSFSQLLLADPPSETEAVRLVLDAARGLEGIHAAGLSHGDINPGNIIIAADGTAKLADLGLARSLFGGDHDPALPRDTNAFLAPECLDRDGVPDIRSDIYALGAVLYTALTGTPPFVPQSAEEADWLDTESADSDPRTLDPDCSAGAAAVVMRCLAEDPADRYQDPSELREDLERLACHFAPMHARSDSQATSQSSDSRAGSPRRRTRAGPILPQTLQEAEDRPLPILTIGLPLVGLMALAILFTWWSIHQQTPVVPPDEPETVMNPVAQPAPASSATGPIWAAAAGDDDYGRWADADLAGLRLRFRYCPAGSFTMGSGGDAGTQRVTLTRGFWLLDRECSQAVWAAVTGERPSHFTGDDLPVDSVSWQDCQRFLARCNDLAPDLPLHLPTEAQWEYACRAGSGPATADPAGAWTMDRSSTQTHPVGSSTANAWGLHDMLGNVMEWCADGHAPYAQTAQIDPQVREGLFRIARGGAWSLPASECHSASRARYQPQSRFFFLGLRLMIPATDG